MPSRDADGKEIGGAEKGRKRKAEIEEARRNEEDRRTDGQPLRYQIGAPPIGNPVAGIAYAHDALLATLDEVLHDKQITAEQRWNLVATLSKALGMTHAKAHVQKKLADLKIEEEEQRDDLNGLQENPLIGRNPTRRRREAEGGQEIRRPVPTTADEDGSDPP